MGRGLQPRNRWDHKRQLPHEGFPYGVPLAARSPCASPARADCHIFSTIVAVFGARIQANAFCIRDSSDLNPRRLAPPRKQLVGRKPGLAPPGPRRAKHLGGKSCGDVVLSLSAGGLRPVSDPPGRISRTLASGRGRRWKEREEVSIACRLPQNMSIYGLCSTAHEFLRDARLEALKVR